MCGNLGAFLNGNMFMGLFGSDVGIKLPEDDQQRLLAEPDLRPTVCNSTTGIPKAEPSTWPSLR